LHFLGTILSIEHTVITGKISGRRDRGRQREKILDGLANWLGERSIKEMIKCPMSVDWAHDDDDSIFLGSQLISNPPRLLYYGACSRHFVEEDGVEVNLFAFVRFLIFALCVVGPVDN
jgi:hypothetical protein